MTDSDSLIHTASEMLAQAVVVSRNVAIYPQKHPSVLTPATEMCNLLKELFADWQRVSFNIVNSEIYIEKQLLRTASLKHSDFLQMLTQWGINSLLFTPEVTPDSIATFFLLLSGAKEMSFNGETLKTRMKEQGVRGIDFDKFSALDIPKDTYGQMGSKADAVRARSSYQEALECMRMVEENLSANKSIDVNNLQLVVSSLMEDFLYEQDGMIGIMGIKSYDEHLFHHSVNVAIISVLIASKFSLDASQIRTIGIAGLMHDIGKLKIPREIIRKPGRLDESEWIVVRRHPIEGAKILMRFETLGELPVLAALEHHAGYDLAGYPALKGKEHPHAVACIIGIADVYEALTANRSYRPAESLNRAVRLLLDGAGTQFDPLLVKLFLNIIGVFPPGSIVHLKTGETAVVVEPNENNPFLPKVQMIDDTSSNPPDSPIINTAEDPTKYAIVGVADSEDV